MQEFTLIKEKACNFVKGTDDRKHVNIKLSEKQLDEIWQVFDGRIKDLTVALGCKLQGEYQNKGLISKSKLRDKGLSQANCKLLYEQYGVQSLRIPSTEDLAFEEIMSIEFTGDVQMYDIEVSNGHNFIANDVLVHNTWKLLRVAAGFIDQNIPILINTREMPPPQIRRRLYAVYFKLPYYEFRRGQLAPNEKDRYFKGLDARIKTLTQNLSIS